MNTLMVIVKGNRFDAARAASKRRIPLVFVDEVFRNGEIVETIGRVSVSFEQDVAKWFVEDVNDGSLFPKGSCLFYAQERSQKEH